MFQSPRPDRSPPALLRAENPFETTRAIIQRAAQLTQDQALPLVPLPRTVTGHVDVYSIALRELRERKLHAQVKRDHQPSAELDTLNSFTHLA